MLAVNRSHLTSNDRWTQADVYEVQQAIDAQGDVENPAALVIGNGMMPYLIPIVKADKLIVVDDDPQVTSMAQRVFDLIKRSSDWDDYLWRYTDERCVATGRFQRGVATVLDDDLIRQHKVAERAGIADFQKIKSLVPSVEVVTVVGNITDTDTVNRVRDELDDNTLRFLNMTNVASWLRPRGLFSPLTEGWNRTRAFIEDIGTPDTAVILDSDRQLRIHIATKDSYRQN